MINNIKSKYIKRLLFKNIRKGLISIAIISSVLISPFSIVYADDDYQSYQIELWQVQGYKYFKNHSTNSTIVLKSSTNSENVYLSTGVSYAYTGTIQESDRLIQNISTPNLLMTYINGSSSFTWADSFHVNSKDDPYIISFLVSFGQSYDSPVFYSYFNSNIHSNSIYLTNYGFGYDLIHYELYSDRSTGDFVCMNFNQYNNKTLNFIPIYFGNKSDIPNDAYLFLYHEQRPYIVTDNLLNNLIENGNNTSQSTGNDLNTVSDELNTGVSNLQSVNETLENDMSTALQNVDTNSLLMQSQNFIKSMNWVKLRFNTMFNNNPLGWYIQISLIIGIAIFMIGRYRK